jgi:hypothetical protein
VALLGSATSVVVDGGSEGGSSAVVRLEVVNVTFSDGRWGVEVVFDSGGEDGVLFVAADASPLPCVDVTTADRCCVQGVGKRPFWIGNTVAEEVMVNCTVSKGTLSQWMGTASEVEVHGDGWATFWLDPGELERGGGALVRTGPNGWEANFSVGLLVPGAFPGASQTEIVLSKSGTAEHFAVGAFTRQVAEFVFVQVEARGEAVYARVWALLSLANVTVVEARYLWADGDGAWVVPVCGAPVPPCGDTRALVDCGDRAEGRVLEAWVPLADWAEQKGNLSVYLVVAGVGGKTLARIFVEGPSTLMARRCGPPLPVPQAVELEVLRGLGLESVYRGPVTSLVELGGDAQVDSLITLVGRGGGVGERLVLTSLRAVHANTEAQREAVAANGTCDGCVVEQLVLDGAVVPPRSCHVLGDGDDLAWIQGYVGLVGSTLARDVLGRVPSDVRLEPAAVVAVWVNPVWPWPDGDVAAEWTFLDAKFEAREDGSRSGRRLLMDEGPWPEPPYGKPPSANRQDQRLRVPWVVVGLAAVAVCLWAVALARG